MPNRPFVLAFIAKCERSFSLAPEERAAIERLPVRIEYVAADRPIVRQGDKPSQSSMILKGIACTSITLASGRRQISAFHIQQDFPDLLSLHLRTMDSDMVALTECKIASIEHVVLRAFCTENPRLCAFLWHLTLVDAAIYRQWVANVGQRSAEQRVAHLLCELAARMRVVGMADGSTYPFHLTQTDLSEATGISTVHMNRSLQSLRARKLISLQKGVLTIPDDRALRKAGDFSADYLHQAEPLRA